MKRKIVQHGPSSLIMSLPSKWIHANGIKRGDELEVQEEKNSLIISTHAITRDDSVTIDVTGLNRTTILIYLQSMYRKGYSEINVTFDNMHAKHYRINKETPVLEIIQEVITRFIGVEIVRQTKNSVQIKQLSEDSEKGFDMLVRRVVFLTTDAFREIEKGLIDNDNDIISTMEMHHKTITKFINYCMRLLNKGTLHDLSDSLTLYHVLATMDKLVDLLKEIGRYKLSKKVHFQKAAAKPLRNIVQSIELYQSLFLKKDLKIAEEIEYIRDVIKRELLTLKSEPNMIPILELFREIPEMLQELVECRLRLS